jgi:hypothetical protein
MAGASARKVQHQQFLHQSLHSFGLNVSMKCVADRACGRTSPRLNGLLLADLPRRASEEAGVFAAISDSVYA